MKKTLYEVTMFPFVITSTSNASLDLYPSNTLTKFCHKLPAPVKLDPKQSHTITLKSIALDIKFAQQKRGGYIKIHLNELDTQSSPQSGDSQCLARIPLPSAGSSSDSIWYSFENPTQAPLADLEEINELNFLITDEQNNQIKLEGFGIPSILIVIIEEMQFQDHFSVTANPRYSADVFSANTDIDFRVKFPGTIEMDSTWEVALHNMIVPMGATLQTHAYAQFNDISYGWDAVSETGDEVFVQVVRDLKRKMDIHLENDMHSNRLTIMAGEKHWKEGDTSTKIYFNAVLCKILRLSIPLSGVYRAIPLRPKVKKSLRSAVSRFNDIRCDHLAIYTDIVGDSIMGNAMCKILEIVSCKDVGLKRQDTDTIFHVPNLTFRPISKFSFNSIHFFITGLDGTVPLLNRDHQDSISISLVFRKKRQ